jgi:3-dehydroquinate synthase
LKTIEVCEFLQEANADKSSLVGVIGGGIVQDIGAYACRTFKRGLPWCYVPTTMLSMTDSCIGGKTGLNHKKYKNMMALFSAPTEVLVCTAFLETLEDGDLRSGLGETLKLCVTGGREPFSAYEKLVDSALARNKDALKKLIYISLLVKKAVVENDEFEKDIRKGLNYGHSIGHALEAVCDFRIPHGIAVAMGIIIENLMFSDISKNYVAADISRINRMAKNLYGSSYDNIIRSLNFDGLKTALFNDKKTQAGSLTLAPAAEVGRLEFTQVNLNSENLDNIIHLIKGHL